MKENIISNVMDLIINKEMQGLGTNNHQTMLGVLNKIDCNLTLSDKTKEEFDLKKNLES